MNFTENYINDSINYYVKIDNYSWSDIIRNTCEGWKNYSTYAHNFYIIFFWIYVISGFIGKFYNPEWFKGKKYVIVETNNKIIKFLKLDFLDFSIKPLELIQNISIWVILARVFYVYYTMRGL